MQYSDFSQKRKVQRAVQPAYGVLAREVEEAEAGEAAHAFDARALDVGGEA